MTEIIAPLKGILRCGHCGGAMKPVFSNKGKKRYHYCYCDQDTKRARSICPVKQIGSAIIEKAVKEQVQKIFNTPFFQERIWAHTGITLQELNRILNDEFWGDISAGVKKLMEGVAS